MIEPGPKTKGLGILIPFGGGRYWSKEYQKNSRKFKICIIMHKYAKYAFFYKCLKITFLGISDDSEHFCFFHLTFFLDLEKFQNLKCSN